MKNTFIALKNALANSKKHYTSEDVVYVNVSFSTPLQVYSSKDFNKLPVGGFTFVAQFTKIGCYLRSYKSDIAVNIAFVW